MDQNEFFRAVCDRLVSEGYGSFTLAQLRNAISYVDVNAIKTVGDWGDAYAIVLSKLILSKLAEAR